MLRAYPSRSEAWELSVAAKCLADDKYDPSSDLEFLKKCPDYKYIFAPDPDGAIRRIAVSSTCGLTGLRRIQARSLKLLVSRGELDIPLLPFGLSSPVSEKASLLLKCGICFPPFEKSLSLALT